ncbi:MAG: hypothetical protein R3324_11380, partial [Halobacteriales archaeon]|nr:hypothetical protein [Halobacteriales archaeon]
MTYDRQLTTTYEGALTAIADKIAGMTSWTMITDQRATGHIALEGPHTDEYLILNSNYMGDGTDAGADFELGGRPNSSYDYGGGNISPFIATHSLNNGNWAADDTFEYWLQYSDQYGFVMYLRRTMADGFDQSFWVGVLDYANGGGQEMWDPRLSDEWQNNGNVDRFYHYCIWGASGSGSGSLGRSDVNNTFIDVMVRGNDSPGGRPRALSRPQGMLNPDTAFTDYVWWSRVLTRDESILNTDTGEYIRWAKITDPLWLEDRSGTDLNSGDVIQDSGGSDEWEIVDFH